MTGNLQVVYAGIEGMGVEMSPNQGQSLDLMTGGVGNPLIVNTLHRANVNPVPNPNSQRRQGQIVLGARTRRARAAEDPIYEGWLYAAVEPASRAFDGLLVTKDFGQNWTEVRIPSASANRIPTNNVNDANYPIVGGGLFTARAIIA